MHHVNLLKLESRPSREKLGEYIFYVKAALPSEDPRRVEIMRELRSYGALTLLS